MHAKLRKRGETYLRSPDTPPASGLARKVLPAWMWDDPAIVAERLECGEQHRTQLREQRSRANTPARPDGVRLSGKPFGYAIPDDRSRPADSSPAVASPKLHARFSPASSATLRSAIRRLIKRARIRELVAMVVKGRAR